MGVPYAGSLHSQKKTPEIFCTENVDHSTTKVLFDVNDRFLLLRGENFHFPLLRRLKVYFCIVRIQNKFTFCDNVVIYSYSLLK